MDDLTQNKREYWRIFEVLICMSLILKDYNIILKKVQASCKDNLKIFQNLVFLKFVIKVSIFKCEKVF